MEGADEPVQFRHVVGFERRADQQQDGIWLDRQDLGQQADQQQRVFSRAQAADEDEDQSLRRDPVP